MQLSTHPDKPAPHLDVNADTGPFVYAVHQMPPGRHYMAAGTNCSWSDWIATWGKVTGARTAYRQLTDDEMAAQPPDREFGVEVTKMFTYMSDPGYDGAMDLLWAEDIRKVLSPFARVAGLAVDEIADRGQPTGRHRLPHDDARRVLRQARLVRDAWRLRRLARASEARRVLAAVSGLLLTVLVACGFRPPLKLQVVLPVLIWRLVPRRFGLQCSRPGYYLLDLWQRLVQ